MEITVFTTIFQGIGYLFVMAIANLCYFLGSLAERIVKPENVMRFRHLSYWLGFSFSVALPFTIPILFVLTNWPAP